MTLGKNPFAAALIEVGIEHRLYLPVLSITTARQAGRHDDDAFFSVFFWAAQARKIAFMEDRVLCNHWVEKDKYHYVCLAMHRLRKSVILRPRAPPIYYSGYTVFERLITFECSDQF
jgi:hypothetical protein